MVNRQKVKGTTWEREACELLTNLVPDSNWKRVAGSGAMGTIMGEPLLFSDIVGEIKAIPKKFRVEAKTGYGGKESGAKQLSVKREWFEKVREEAGGTYAIPACVFKFSGAKGDSRAFIGFDLKAFGELMTFVHELYVENEKMVAQLHEE